MGNESNIFVLAESFRKVLEMYGKKTGLVSFENFPLGSCGDSSLLLAMFLKQHGLSNIKYVLGHSYGRSHAWLKVQELIVDITADQFENNPSVIVAAESPFHRAFEVEGSHQADMENYDERTKIQLLAAFKTLTECRESALGFSISRG